MLGCNLLQSLGAITEEGLSTIGNELERGEIEEEKRLGLESVIESKK